MACCAYCYKTFERESDKKKCGQCHKRLYCGRECQRLDWTTGHKRWCNEAGEIDVDYEIRPCQDKTKGVGVFALKAFKRGDKVMAERRLISSPFEVVPEAAKAAVDALLPHGGSIGEKCQRNSLPTFDPGYGAYGLFVQISRVNHDCIGNTDYHYHPVHGVMIVVSSRHIEIGEEITFTYTNTDDSTVLRGRRAYLKKELYFDCCCAACTDENVDAKLIRMCELDQQVERLMKKSQNRMALHTAKELIALYDEMGSVSLEHYVRTYDRMMLIAGHIGTRGQVADYGRLAWAAASKFYGPDHVIVQTYRLIAQNADK